MFGEDAKEFNPNREAPSGQNVYGLSFGLGMHSCIGRNLAAGVVPKEDTDPNDHHYGTVALILNKLFEHNAQPDPDNAPKKGSEINDLRTSFTMYRSFYTPTMIQNRIRK